MNLYPWQESAVRTVISKLRISKRVLAVSPTGSGKTVMAAAIVQRTRSARVLWVAHRRELLDQAYRSLIHAGAAPERLGILDGSRKPKETPQILIASIQNVARQKIGDFDLVVIDEAHRTAAASYRLVLKDHAGYVLGITATPWRLDGSPLGDVYEDMHVCSTIAKLEESGHLAKLRTYGLSKARARELVRGLSGGSDYNQRELSQRMRSRFLMGETVRECARLAPGQRTLVFAVDRKHAKALTKRFRASGRPTEYLDGDTPAAERTLILDGLRTGQIEVVVNVDVLTEGYDCPAVGCVAIARPTKSLTRYLQMCGRSTRPHGDWEPIILDHGGVAWRFGLPTEDREWSLHTKAKSTTEGDCVCVEGPDGEIRLVTLEELELERLRKKAEEDRARDLGRIAELKAEYEDPGTTTARRHKCTRTARRVYDRLGEERAEWCAVKRELPPPHEKLAELKAEYEDPKTTAGRRDTCTLRARLIYDRLGEEHAEWCAMKVKRLPPREKIAELKAEYEDPKTTQVRKRSCTNAARLIYKRLGEEHAEWCKAKR